MRIIGLQTVRRFSKTSSCLGAKTPSSGSLKNEEIPEPVYQSSNTVSNIFKYLNFII